MAKFSTEAAMAKIVVAWLIADEWDVYQEVEPPQCSGTADIVATRGHILWIIECKRTMSMDLLAQAMDWRGWGHRVSVAVPALKMSWGRRGFLKRVMGDYDIGWLSVQDPKARNAAYNAPVKELIRPGFQRRLKNTRMRDCLTERHKTYAEAGTASGRRWTPFKATCEALVRVVKAKPGIPIADLLKEVDHHYSSDSSARSQITRLSRDGVIKGIEVRKEGRRLKVYPT